PRRQHPGGRSQACGLLHDGRGQLDVHAVVPSRRPAEPRAHRGQLRGHVPRGHDGLSAYPRRPIPVLPLGRSPAAPQSPRRPGELAHRGVASGARSARATPACAFSTRASTWLRQHQTEDAKEEGRELLVFPRSSRRRRNACAPPGTRAPMTELALPESRDAIPPASAGRPDVLLAEGIRMRFGGVVALDNVSISVRDDELLAIIGPNGAGKTSLMNCLSGFYRPQEG